MELNCAIKDFDSNICAIKNLVDALDQNITTTKQEIPLINLMLTHKRADAISMLRHINGELKALVLHVTDIGRAADAIHNEEIRMVRNGISQAAQTALGKPAQGKPPADQELDSNAEWFQKISIPGPKAKTETQAQMIQIAPNVKIPAVAVPAHLRGKELVDAVQPGKLYYIPQWNHFAVNIGGAFLHAGIGNIYRGRVDAPALVKDCWKGNCSRVNCRYFHDPELFAGSTDVRNYIFDSCFYVPAFATTERTGARRIGDAENLENDLKTITAQDARRFMSGAMHDLLCAILVRNAVAD